MPGRPWTNEELTLLKEHYPETGSTVLRDHLNRSVKAINSQAHQFDLRSMEKYQEWSDEEAEDLKRLYPNTPKDDLLNHFNRSWVSIWHKASRLGIYREYEYIPNQITMDIATDFEIGFIVGLIEGEGSVSFTGSPAELNPSLRISNMNLDLLKKAQEIIGGNIFSEELHKDVYSYDLALGGIKDIYETLEKLVPHFIVKRRATELMLEFCQSRMSGPQNAPYRKKEREIVSDVKRLSNPNRIRNKEWFKGVV